MTRAAGFRSRVGWFAAAPMLALLGGCAGLPTPPPHADEAAGGPRLAFSTLALAGTEIGAEWQLPARPPQAPLALMLLQHGFARQCANLRETARRIAATGVATLCLNADMAGGQPALAAALAAAWAAGLALPDGQSAPERLIVGGHSAGALFAAEVGRAVAARAPQRLAGAILFDPVGGAGLTAALLAVSDGGRRPVRAMAALASRCNAQGLGMPALAAVHEAALAAGGDGFVGVLLLEGSTHIDAEGADTDTAAVLACGDGWPRPDNTELLRELAARWVREMAQARADPAPAAAGLTSIDALAAAGRLRPLP